MQSYLYHLQLNINFVNIDFYKQFMSLLGWSVIFEEKDVIGFKSGKSGDLWFVKSERFQQSDYDSVGINHISVRVNKLKDVDAVAGFLKQHTIALLFDTPLHRPEFTSSENETYYQIMFESPDKILFEIVYIGPNN